MWPLHITVFSKCPVFQHSTGYRTSMLSLCTKHSENQGSSLGTLQCAIHHIMCCMWPIEITLCSKWLLKPVYCVWQSVQHSECGLWHNVHHMAYAHYSVKYVAGRVICGLCTYHCMEQVASGHQCNVCLDTIVCSLCIPLRLQFMVFV